MSTLAAQQLALQANQPDERPHTLPQSSATPRMQRLRPATGRQEQPTKHEEDLEANALTVCVTSFEAAERGRRTRLTTFSIGFQRSCSLRR